MGTATTELKGPDLAAGVALSEIPQSGLLLGHAEGKAVLLVRQGGELFAVSASCSHYGAPLADGLLIDGALRCPWHHAAFDVRTGAPLRPPALNALGCFEVVQDGARVRVGAEKKTAARAQPVATVPESVLIVGSGAAGQVAAETLRREGYEGPITLIGAEAPVDRPNLSKDYLAGNAPEDWIPLRPPEFFTSSKIDLRTNERVTQLDAGARMAWLSDGKTLRYGALLLATGAEPIALTTPGATLPHVHMLRTLGDSRAIIAAAAQAKTAVVIGSGFIGLEVAASLRARGLGVNVITPEALPLQRVLGDALGTFIRDLHREKGVTFHFGASVRAIHETEVELNNGDLIPADLVVVGRGVKPNAELAAKAGLRIDEGGVSVDEFLQSSEPSVWAAGDVAAWPDALLGRRHRVEHWVVAQRQGQVAAQNMLGRRVAFRAAPFFWSAHYDAVINYVGSGAGFDSAELKGDPSKRDCLVAYRTKGTLCAIATINRDRDSLLAEHFLETGNDDALEALVRAAR